MDILVRSEIPGAVASDGKVFTNNFAFKNVGGATSQYIQPIFDAIVDFFMAMAPNALAEMKQFMSPEIDNTAGMWNLRAYDLTGKLAGGPANRLGSPVYENVATFEGSTADLAGLPAEVAVCLTLESATRASQPVEIDDSGDAGTERDRPMQRHTGRLYIGPLNVSTLLNDGQVVRPNENILDTVRLAADELQSAVTIGADDAEWCIWSRKDATLRRVEFVSVDNAFDTVRGRGADPTTRQRTEI